MHVVSFPPSFSLPPPYAGRERLNSASARVDWYLHYPIYGCRWMSAKVKHDLCNYSNKSRRRREKARYCLLLPPPFCSSTLVFFGSSTGHSTPLWLICMQFLRLCEMPSDIRPFPMPPSNWRVDQQRLGWVYVPSLGIQFAFF